MSARKEPQWYEIKLKGHLDEHWSRWFDNLTVTNDEVGHTILSGPIADQAALHGLLIKILGLGLTLLSVNCIEPDDERPRGER